MAKELADDVVLRPPDMFLRGMGRLHQWPLRAEEAR